MLESLARTLIERGIINNNTQVEAWYWGKDLASNLKRMRDFFNIGNVKEVKNKVIFDVYRNDGFTTTIKTEDIINVDGMTPDLIARAFCLNIDGSSRKMGMKRGRKSKVRPVELDEAA